MKEKTLELFEVNTDILVLLKIVNEIGWKEIRESSIHRILYLSSVLYAFMNSNKDQAFSNYHFSLSATGPYSEIVFRSLIDLKRREFIIEEESGNVRLNLQQAIANEILNEKSRWFEVVIYILGLYGENRIFGFVIQDPQYKNDFQRNSQTAIDISDQNKTVETLKQFKEAFEETLEDVSRIDDKEYLELYFEYVFSKILKRE